MSPIPFLRTGARARGFTLIELLVVIAIIAVLAIVVILVLNPGELIKESRDADRLSDLKTISSAISIYSSQDSGYSGNVSTTYLSVADPSATSTAGDQCQGVGLSVSSTLGCASTSTFRKTDATGWIPVNFAAVSFGTPLAVLPVDPVNATSGNLYYTFNGSPFVYELSAGMESQKYGQSGKNDVVTNDGGQYADRVEVGTNVALLPFDPGNASSGSSSGLVISGLTVSSITTSSALVSWSTNQAADSRVNYGLTSGYGSTSYNASQITSHAISLTGLQTSTLYHYQVVSVNPSSTATSSDQIFDTLGINGPPNAPSEDSPLNNTTSTLTPVFKMTATDPNGDLLQYEATIYSNAICTAAVQTDDETASQVGWSGQNASGSTAYSSGSQGTFTVQSALTASTTYYWTAGAIDPWGSDTWTNSATCNSFTTLPLPGSPGTPTYTAIATSTLTVNWTAATNASYYKVERSPNGTAFAQIATTSALSYGDSGLTASTTYWYRARATDLSGDGSYSASSSVATLSGGLVGYQFDRSITVTANTSLASGTNANFPILISTTLSDLKASSSGGAVQNLCTAPNGGQEPCDLVFETSATCTSTPLNFETESYTPSTGALVDWVNVPSLSAGSVIYACYDNAAVATDQSNPYLTWNNNYLGVWHLPNGTTLTENDSTVNGNNGTPVNGPTAAGGEIYGGANLVSASTQYVTVGNGINPSAITISGWIKATSLANAYEGTFCRDNGTSFACLFLKSNGKLALYVTAGGMVDYDGTGANTLSAGTWYDVAMTYDSVNGLKGYVNGSLDGSAAANGALTTGAAASRLGSDPANASREFNGVIDEMRVASVAFSPSWILTEYNNQANPASFMTIGSAQMP